MIEYAANDVQYLLRIYDTLSVKLHNAEIGKVRFFPTTDKCCVQSLYVDSRRITMNSFVLEALYTNV